MMKIHVYYHIVEKYLEKLRYIYAGQEYRQIQLQKHVAELTN